MKETSFQTGFTVVGGQRETILDSLRELWRFRALILELVRRDLKIRYKGRVGGILWSLFPPLMQVLTITLMVKFFLASGVKDYSAYLMPVMFFWQFFQNTVLDCSQAMLQNSALARKTYFPRAVLPLVTFISNLLHFFISFIFTLFYFFVAPIQKPFPFKIYPNNIQFPEILLAGPCIMGMGVFALGIGFLLSYMTTIYDDIKFLSITLLGLVFYSLPILYPIEKVYAHPNIYPIYMLNPMAVWLVGLQRSLIHAPSKTDLDPGLTPVLMSDLYLYLGIATVTSIATLIFGFYIFEKSKWAMMERL